MAQRGRIIPYRNEDIQNEDLRLRIREHEPDEAVCNIMLKDIHLIETALAADEIVSSLDEAVRGHFKRICDPISEIQQIVWVNPTYPEEACIPWLREGAKSEDERKLGYNEEK